MTPNVHACTVAATGTGKSVVSAFDYHKFAALLANTTHSVQREIKDGFVNLPKGCYIQLERKAKKYILNNIRSSFGVKAGIVSHIAAFVEDTGKPLTLSNFLEYYHLDLRTVYSRACFARLCVLAGVEIIAMRILKRFELLRYNLNRIDLVDESLEVGFNFALDLHCTYSMRQIATAMGYLNYSALQGIGPR